MKLILTYIATDDNTYSCPMIIPFEYESKDKFIFDMFETYNNKYWGKNLSCTIFNCDLCKDEFDTLEHYVYTLDEWFDKFQYK